MSRKKRGIPNAVVLPNGEQYVLCILQVLTEDANGEPETLRYVPNRESFKVNLKGNERFITAYIKDCNVTT